jgi:NitT/TauT family transport system substrate-binding protein
MDLYLEGKIDAFLIASPFNRVARARNIDHVIVDSLTDPPWSQYYCCMLARRRISPCARSKEPT